MVFLKILGGILIVSGTAIGAGILALPIIAVNTGLIPILILLMITCFFMCIAAVLLLEVNLIAAPGSSFLKMTKNVLGPIAHSLSFFSYLFLFYALLAAYISGSVTFLSDLQQYYQATYFSTGQLTILIVTITGVILFSGTNMLDQMNKMIFILMMSCFIFIIISLQPAMQETYLIHQLNKSTDATVWLAVLPVLLTAFGYHGCTTPLIGYIGVQYHKTLRYVFIIGGLLPCFLYVIWLLSSLATLTHESQAILMEKNQLSTFLQLLSNVSDSTIFMFILRLFSGFAILTSFLGISLGLFDSIHTIFKMKDSLIIYIITAIITFVPPLLLCRLYPDLFITALGYAAIPLAFIATITPLLMMRCLKKSGHIFHQEYRYWAVGCFGLIVILIQLAVTVGYLSKI
ncbi:MAG: hypothetical protein HAW62_01090 [Endozoicomonadaceae bacterium]|nr:hypothetical protein [Endozoicomonadaceae bacterium]